MTTIPPGVALDVWCVCFDFVEWVAVIVFVFFSFFNQLSIAFVFLSKTNEGGALLKMEGLVLPTYRLPSFGGWVGWLGGVRSDWRSPMGNYRVYYCVWFAPPSLRSHIDFLLQPSPLGK